ncbi:MAG: hypothetical protein ACK53T_00165 [Planctomycetota bacterium]
MTNGKELILRARQQGVPVSDDFMGSFKFADLNVVADALEVEFGCKITGEHVVAPENGWYFIDWAKGTICLQSTIMPDCKVTIPLTDRADMEPFVNDLCASGLWRVWG